MLQRLSAPMRSAAVSVLLALLSASPVRAQSAAAPPLVLECAPCHGFDGIGQDDGIPNLAGQHQTYLNRQVLAFRSGARRHPEMNFFARQASQDEFTIILDYYAGLRRP